MAIIQISKIQQRSGNLVDLPQLDEAQLGWANDAKRLFIGTAAPNTNENVEERLEAMLAQVEFRDWVQSELRTYRKSVAYLAGQEVGGAAQIKKLMYEYLYDVLFQDGNVFLPSAMANEADSIKVDQDVIRTVAPPDPILGYSQIPKEAKLLSAKNVGPIVTRKHRVIAPYTARTGELIALVRRSPGKYTYGSPGIGTFQHVMAETVKSRFFMFSVSQSTLRRVLQ
jgi:hypothetical protein